MSYRFKLAKDLCDSFHWHKREMTDVIWTKEQIKKQFLLWLHFGLRFKTPTVDLMEYLREVPSLIDKRVVGCKTIRESIVIHIEEDFADFVGPYVDQAFNRQDVEKYKIIYEV